MSNITKYPLEDSFKTSLSQTWAGGTGTMNVTGTPNFTFPSGITTYVVVNPGKSNMQIAEINAYDGSAKTLTVSNITLEKGASVNSTAQTHNVGSEVIISDNFQFWSDIATAINSKLDDDADWTWDSATTFAGMIGKSLTTAQRDALTPSAGMIIYNSDDSELNVYQGGAWSAIASGSTQPNASETVAGKVEIATLAQRDAETDTGETGAQLVVIPSRLRVIGEITMRGAAAAPTGWLLCDDSAVSRTTYADLFAVIGTTYGVGDGSTTFNVPDLRGNVPVGKDSGTFATLGATGGAETHALTEAEMPAHTHTVDLYPDAGSTGVTDNGGGASVATQTTSSTGSGTAHNILQPYQVVNFIIKT